MWVYERKLQYPVNIKNPNPRLAGIIVSQLGGPDGELGAAMRYLNQRYTMPSGEAIGILTDVGSEELGHVEMIGSKIDTSYIGKTLDLTVVAHAVQSENNPIEDGNTYTASGWPKE